MIAIPPSTRAQDKTNLSDINSCIKIIPPAADINGTLNCDTAALVDGIFGRIKYHNAYPIPDVIAPEQIANSAPVFDHEKPVLFGSKKIIIKQIGVEIRKLAVVAEIADSAFFPKIE